MTSYVRESLIFEVGLKENLLKNIEISLELARCQVDSLQVKEKGENSKDLAPTLVLLAAPRWAPQGWVWSTAPLALERPLSAVPSPTRSSKCANISITLSMVCITYHISRRLRSS